MSALLHGIGTRLTDMIVFALVVGAAADLKFEPRGCGGCIEESRCRHRAVLPALHKFASVRKPLLCSSGHGATWAHYGDVRLRGLDVMDVSRSRPYIGKKRQDFSCSIKLYLLQNSCFLRTSLVIFENMSSLFRTMLNASDTSLPLFARQFHQLYKQSSISIRLAHLQYLERH